MDRREERREPCEAVGRVGRGEVGEEAGEVDIRTLETTVWGREEEDIVVRIGPVLGSASSGHLAFSKERYAPYSFYQEVKRSASRASSDC